MSTLRSAKITSMYNDGEGSDLENIENQIGKGAGFVFLFEELKRSSISIDDLVNLFSVLNDSASPAPSFFFQKCVDLKTANESVLGFNSFEKIFTLNGRTYAEQKKEKIELKGNPIEVISERLEKYKVIPNKKLPFFQTGAMGYFGYDS